MLNFVVNITFTTKKISLTSNFSNQKLLVTIMTNLNIGLQNKKIMITKIVIIMDKKL